MIDPNPNSNLHNPINPLSVPSSPAKITDKNRRDSEYLPMPSVIGEASSQHIEGTVKRLDPAKHFPILQASLVRLCDIKINYLTKQREEIEKTPLTEETKNKRLDLIDENIFEITVLKNHVEDLGRSVNHGKRGLDGSSKKMSSEDGVKELQKLKENFYKIRSQYAIESTGMDKTQPKQPEVLQKLTSMREHNTADVTLHSVHPEVTHLEGEHEPLFVAQNLRKTEEEEESKSFLSSLFAWTATKATELASRIFITQTPEKTKLPPEVSPQSYTVNQEDADIYCKITTDVDSKEVTAQKFDKLSKKVDDAIANAKTNLGAQAPAVSADAKTKQEAQVNFFKNILNFITQTKNPPSPQETANEKKQVYLAQLEEIKSALNYHKAKGTGDAEHVQQARYRQLSDKFNAASSTYLGNTRSVGLEEIIYEVKKGNDEFIDLFIHTAKFLKPEEVKAVNAALLKEFARSDVSYTSRIKILAYFEKFLNASWYTKGLLSRDDIRSIMNITIYSRDYQTQKDLVAQAKKLEVAIKKDQMPVKATESATLSVVAAPQFLNDLNSENYNEKLSQAAHDLRQQNLEFFRNIKADEFINDWGKNKELSPQVNAFIKHFNQVSYFFRDHILSIEDRKERGQAIEFAIDLAKKCIDAQDYSSAQAIVSALDSVPIYRLKTTFAEAVDAEHKAMLKDIGSFFLDNNYKQVRNKMAEDIKANKTVIPYLGICLTDILMANEKYVNKENEINLNGLKQFNKVFELLNYVVEGANKAKREAPLTPLGNEIRGIESSIDRDDRQIKQALKLDPKPPTVPKPPAA